MQSKELTVDNYIKSLPEDKAVIITKLRKLINQNLPKGFKEGMMYGIMGWVVPLSRYPEGYHVSPGTPLGFISLAAQKNFIAIYHMGLYCNPKLLKWFTDEYAKAEVGKLDMGKSCIRFKNPDKIPYSLIGELASKMTMDEYVTLYDTFKPRKK